MLKMTHVPPRQAILVGHTAPHPALALLETPPLRLAQPSVGFMSDLLMVNTQG